MRRCATAATSTPVFREPSSEAGGQERESAHEHENRADSREPAAEPHLYEGADWDFRDARRSTRPARNSRSGELGLDVFTNQIEVISAEQMLDALFPDRDAALLQALVLRARHFATQGHPYRKGMRGLAYEIRHQFGTRASPMLMGARIRADDAGRSSSRIAAFGH